jgi:hypothetical protein
MVVRGMVGNGGEIRGELFDMGIGKKSQSMNAPSSDEFFSRVDKKATARKNHRHRRDGDVD